MSTINVFVAFDLKNGTNDDHDKLQALFTELGLSSVSLHEQVELPSGLVMGSLELNEVIASEFRDFIWEQVDEQDINLERIFVGVLNTWAARSVTEK